MHELNELSNQRANNVRRKVKKRETRLKDINIDKNRKSINKLVKNCLFSLASFRRNNLGPVGSAEKHN